MRTALAGSSLAPGNLAVTHPVNLGNETVLIKMMNLMAISKSEQVTKLLLAQGRMQPAPWKK